MNQVNQSTSRPTNVDNKSRQNMTRFCPYCRKIDTLSCTAEPKLTMMKLRDNRHEITESAEQSSLMITINGEDLTLGLRIIKISVSNPDTETRTIRHPFDKLASTQIETEIQTQMDSITKTDRTIPATTDHIAVSRLSITLMLNQKTQTQILNTTETFHRATIYLHRTQFNLSMIRYKM